MFSEGSAGRVPHNGLPSEYLAVLSAMLHIAAYIVCRINGGDAVDIEHGEGR
jgi:hypothetical protein